MTNFIGPDFWYLS